jgi:Ca2+-binding EF-hand superfamily protein
MGNILEKQTENYCQLTDDLLNSCHEATGLNHEVIHREHDRFFDLAEDGRLRKVYLEELLGEHIPGMRWKCMKYLIDCIFIAIDTNNNGSIDFLEYLMSLKFFQSESPQEKADFIFRILDRNGDNNLTKKELERILECLEDYHKHSSNTDVTHLMNQGSKSAADVVLGKLDEDKSGVINRKVFVDGWLKDATIRALFTF